MMIFLFMQKGSDYRKEQWNGEWKRKEEIKCKGMEFWRGFNKFVYLYKKKFNQQKVLKKKYMWISTYEEGLVKFLLWYFYSCKKDVIIEKNDGMENGKGKRKLNAKKWRSGEVLIDFFIYIKKSNLIKVLKENICKSLTYEEIRLMFLPLYLSLYEKFNFHLKITFLRL